MDKENFRDLLNKMEKKIPKLFTFLEEEVKYFKINFI